MSGRKEASLSGRTNVLTRTEFAVISRNLIMHKMKRDKFRKNQSHYCNRVLRDWRLGKIKFKLIRRYDPSDAIVFDEKDFDYLTVIREPDDEF